MNKILLLVLLFLVSCSSSAKPKKWYIDDVAMEKRKWRWCHKSKDGPDLHEKGICYITKRCRKRFLLKPKCEKLQLHCKHGDIACLQENKWPQIRGGNQ